MHSRQECNSPHAFPASPCQHDTSCLTAYADLLAPGAAQDNVGEGNGSSGPRRGQHQCIATRSSSGRMYPLPKRRPSQRRRGRCEVALHVWFVHIDLWDGPAFFGCIRPKCLNAAVVGPCFSSAQCQGGSGAGSEAFTERRWRSRSRGPLLLTRDGCMNAPSCYPSPLYLVVPRRRVQWAPCRWVSHGAGYFHRNLAWPCTSSTRGAASQPIRPRPGWTEAVVIGVRGPRGPVLACCCLHTRPLRKETSRGRGREAGRGPPRRQPLEGRGCA